MPPGLNTPADLHRNLQMKNPTNKSLGEDRGDQRELGEGGKIGRNPR